MKKEESKSVYALWVLRRDGDHISVIESSNYDEVYEAYNEVKAKWISSIKEQTPFELTKPVVACFDPGLIYEVTIKPITQVSSSRYENPYQQEMVKNGFSTTFKPSSDILDNGYR